MRFIKLTAAFVNHHTGDYETMTPFYINTDTVTAIRSNDDGTTFIATIGDGCYTVVEDAETILELMEAVTAETAVEADVNNEEGPEEPTDYMNE